jgi:hypothetical protein
VINVDEVKEFLPYDMLSSGIGGPNDIIDLRADVMRYHPEVRCTTRYQLYYGSDHSPCSHIMFAKRLKPSGDQGQKYVHV